ncbi:sodium:solute symporter family transporter [Haloarcula onubensis]|uniref:Sodium:proline symporter n=1 Tax=Haloarcula onubensis TaxID=2950539 RepID=A0ABU2FNI5_9EURY|nr:sodium:proline symporter [Halomicroarcula sp. S3CR25-11]MDS0281974.1 sodium:proline symporter [Halomicroarcula sp. S3CR25-11]
MVSTTLALALTVATLVAFAALGIRYSRRGTDSTDDFLTARNSMGPGRTTATLVASSMGVWILLSAPEAGAGFGIAAAVGYGVGTAVPMFAYSKLGPRVRELLPEGHSLTEYAHARYGSAMYGFVVLVSALYMFVFVAAELTGIAAALSLVAGVPQWQTAVLVGGFVLLYTGYGGLRATIVTDTVQAVLVVPLLALVVGGVVLAVGGPGAAASDVATTSPTLLDPTGAAGLQFGLALAVAIFGAEMVNQTWWQRVYASRDSETVAGGFRNATVLNGAIVVVAALLGTVAVGQGGVVTDVTSPAYNADVAFFVLVESAFGEAVLLAVVLLALLLVVSSVDSLFSALASLVTADLPRLLSDPDDRTLRLGARLLTLVVAVAAIYVSLRARSVLRLFFFADLLGAAVAVPLLYGLYSRRLTGRGALVSSVAGLGVGLAFFPDFRGVLTAIPVAGDLLPAADPLYLTAFGGAVVVSTVATLVVARLSSADFDFDRLADAGTVTVTDGGAESSD